MEYWKQVDFEEIKPNCWLKRVRWSVWQICRQTIEGRRNGWPFTTRVLKNSMAYWPVDPWYLCWRAIWSFPGILLFFWLQILALSQHCFQFYSWPPKSLRGFVALFQAISTFLVKLSLKRNAIEHLLFLCPSSCSTVIQKITLL